MSAKTILYVEDNEADQEPSPDALSGSPQDVTRLARIWPLQAVVSRQPVSVVHAMVLNPPPVSLTPCLI